MSAGPARASGPARAESAGTTGTAAAKPPSAAGTSWSAEPSAPAAHLHIDADTRCGKGSIRARLAGYHYAIAYLKAAQLTCHKFGDFGAGGEFQRDGNVTADGYGQWAGGGDFAVGG